VLDDLDRLRIVVAGRREGAHIAIAYVTALASIYVGARLLPLKLRAPPDFAAPTLRERLSANIVDPEGIF
jgi:hypothetical protein